jgi:E3 ubiquitin-protein ligase RNF1/2
MRYLRPDPNFEGLIAQIYPNLDEYEAKQDSIIEEINKNVMQRKTLLQNVEQGKKRQAMAKSNRVLIHHVQILTFLLEQTGL